VHLIFEHVFSLSKQEQTSPDGTQIWTLAADDKDLSALLDADGFADAGTALNAIRQFKQAAAIRRLSGKGAAVLDRLMPQLLTALKETENPDIT